MDAFPFFLVNICMLNLLLFVTGDIEVRIQCSQAMSAPCHPRYRSVVEKTPQHLHSLRTKVESYIKQILQNHLQIRPRVVSQANMGLWMAQATEIQRLTDEAGQLIGTLGEHNRAVYDVTTGSVVIKINCSTLLGVLDVWQSYECGALQGLVGELFGGQKLWRLTGINGVELKVSMCYLQYTKCLDELGKNIDVCACLHHVCLYSM